MISEKKNFSECQYTNFAWGSVFLLCGLWVQTTTTMTTNATFVTATTASERQTYQVCDLLTYCSVNVHLNVHMLVVGQ